MSLLFTQLQVRPAQLASVLQWYEKCLGMSIIRRFDNGAVWVGFADQAGSAMLEFVEHDSAVKGYVPRSKDIYWKVGLGLPDVSLACRCLQKNGISISSPHQFIDIGFMSHMDDSIGYNIELLQHQFGSNFSEAYAKSLSVPDHPLGQVAVIGQLTLRISNAERSLKFYRDTLGMKLLSRQEVRGMFELYFLADTSDNPPSEDIDAVENREWLWQRPYTTLELQHPLHGNSTFSLAPENELGFRAFAIRTSAEKFKQLEKSYSGAQEHPVYKEQVLSIKDPDGAPLLVFSK